MPEITTEIVRKIVKEVVSDTKTEYEKLMEQAQKSTDIQLKQLKDSHASVDQVVKKLDTIATNFPNLIMQAIATHEKECPIVHKSEQQREEELVNFLQRSKPKHVILDIIQSDKASRLWNKIDKYIYIAAALTIGAFLKPTLTKLVELF